MNDKVVYLFGAGASFNAIPVVSGMGMRLRTFLNYFDYHKEEKQIVGSVPDAVVQKTWRALVGEVNESYSIDTLARRAWLSNDLQKFSDIKQLIGAYILWEEIVKPDQNSSIDLIRINPLLGDEYIESTNRFNYLWDGSYMPSDKIRDKDIKLKNTDYRYESLISVIAEERFKLSDRFSFISWNYDNQLEMAVDRVFGLRNDWNANDENSERRINEKMHGMLRNRFYKLNGSASLSSFDFEPPSRFYKECRSAEMRRIRDFLGGVKKFDNRIHFAWEEKPEFDHNRFLNILTEANIVIIIGYSFPEYNRVIDKQIIDKAAKGFNKKFIIQDTAENIDRIDSRLKSIKSGIDVTKITDLNQFYIPL